MISDKQFKEYKQRVKKAKCKTAEVNYRAGAMVMLLLIEEDNWSEENATYYKNKFLKEIK